MSNFRFRSSLDSAMGSHSASTDIPNSQQSCFSQISTQDMFSQLPNNTGSQCEHSQEKNQRMSMYEKWLSRKAKQEVGIGSFTPGCPSKETKTLSLIPANSRNNVDPVTPSFLPRRPSNINVAERAFQEREDRLDQLLYSLQESYNEICTCLNDLKNKLEKDSHTSDQVSGWMKTSLEDIWKQEKDILHTLHQQNKDTISKQDLKDALAKEYSKFDAFSKHFEVEKDKNTKAMEKIIKETLQSPHQSMRKTMEGIAQCSTEMRDAHSQWTCDIARQMEKQTDDIKRVQRDQKQSHRDLEKIVLSEFEKQQREMNRVVKESAKAKEADFMKKLMSELQKHQREVNCILKKNSAAKEALADVESKVLDQVKQVEAVVSCEISTGFDGLNTTLHDIHKGEQRKYIQDVIRKETGGIKLDLELHVNQQFKFMNEKFHKLQETLDFVKETSQQKTDTPLDEGLCGSIRIDKLVDNADNGNQCYDYRFRTQPFDKTQKDSRMVSSWKNQPFKTPLKHSSADLHQQVVRKRSYYHSENNDAQRDYCRITSQEENNSLTCSTKKIPKSTLPIIPRQNQGPSPVAAIMPQKQDPSIHSNNVLYGQNLSRNQEPSIAKDYVPRRVTDASQRITANIDIHQQFSTWANGNGSNLLERQGHETDFRAGGSKNQVLKEKNGSRQVRRMSAVLADYKIAMLHSSKSLAAEDGKMPLGESLAKLQKRTLNSYPRNKGQCQSPGPSDMNKSVLSEASTPCVSPMFNQIQRKIRTPFSRNRIVAASTTRRRVNIQRFVEISPYNSTTILSDM